MINAFEAGDVLTTDDGVPMTICGVAGVCGGYLVYDVEYNGRPYLLRWCSSSYLEALRAKSEDAPSKIYSRLKKMVSEGAPDEAFAWPVAVTEWERGENNSFGYVIPRIDSSAYTEFTDYLLCKVGFKNMQTMLTACINIAYSLERLYQRGIFFGCLDNTDIFINADKGSVRLAFGDKLLLQNGPVGMLGKAMYLAPEISTGAAPDEASERFTLAIILFRIMMNGQHPFVWINSLNNEDSTADGLGSAFIFDLEDGRNAPDPKRHRATLDRWLHYPKYIRELFLGFFSGRGVSDPVTRPTLEQIIDALVRLRGELMPCPVCGEGIIWVDEIGEHQCDRCQSTALAKVRLILPDKSIPLATGMYVYCCQIDPLEKELGEVAFRLLRNSEKGLFGLGNLMQGKTIAVIGKDGIKKEANHAQVAVIANGDDVVICEKKGKIEIINS